jgi:hypothetical protein
MLRHFGIYILLFGIGGLFRGFGGIFLYTLLIGPIINPIINPSLITNYEKGDIALLTTDGFPCAHYEYVKGYINGKYVDTSERKLSTACPDYTIYKLK